MRSLTACGLSCYGMQLFGGRSPFGMDDDDMYAGGSFGGGGGGFPFGAFGGMGGFPGGAWRGVMVPWCGVGAWREVVQWRRVGATGARLW